MVDRRRALDRVLRVRTLQLGLARADEVRARDRLRTETALAHRIMQLVDEVAPVAANTPALALGAAANLRGRLHQSADAARSRVGAAEEHARQTTDASRSAKRDQSSVEKLIDRADADAALTAIRVLQDAPPVRKVRHELC